MIIISFGQSVFSPTYCVVWPAQPLPPQTTHTVDLLELSTEMRQSVFQLVESVGVRRPLCRRCSGRHLFPAEKVDAVTGDRQISSKIHAAVQAGEAAAAASILFSL